MRGSPRLSTHSTRIPMISRYTVAVVLALASNIHGFGSPTSIARSRWSMTAHGSAEGVNLSRREFGAGLIGASLLGGASGVLAEEGGSTEGTSVAAEATTEATTTPDAAPTPPQDPRSAFDYTVPFNGKQVPMSKFLGSKATLIVNGKQDDPISQKLMPDLAQLAAKYGREGLHVLVVPTDQGYYEPDEDRIIKIKLYQVYGFGQYPVAVVTDKIDIVGSTGHPLYKYLCKTMKNPYGIGRITLNYEKFLVGPDGRPLRRYPRKLEGADLEPDIKAVLAGQPLPPESKSYKVSWLKAQDEAIKSEYAFKLGLNYYNN